MITDLEQMFHVQEITIVLPAILLTVFNMSDIFILGVLHEILVLSIFMIL